MNVPHFPTKLRRSQGEGREESVNAWIPSKHAESNDVTYEAYVSEQNLLLDNSKEPVKHPLIEEIFSGKKGSNYFKISN